MLLAPAREENHHEKKQEENQRGPETRKEPSPPFREVQHCNSFHRSQLDRRCSPPTPRRRQP
jgi:hypothetical protein